MKQFEVVVPDYVWAEVDAHVIFIARHSVDNALAWEVRLRAAILNLGSFHGHGRDEEASRQRNSDIRKYVFEGTFLIHYEVNAAASRVEVVGFRHGARLPRRGEP